MHGLDHLEGLPRVDRVDQEISMHANGVLGWEEGILILNGQPVLASIAEYRSLGQRCR